MQRKINELGRNPKCQICGENDITMLIPTAKSLLEKHHIAGNHEGETIIVCRNCHAKLTDAQLDWPAELFDNDRTPEMNAVAFFLGLAAILGVLAVLCTKHAMTLFFFVDQIQGVIPQ